MKPLRLAVAVTHPIQYFAPLFRELAQRPGIELKVYYASDPSLESRFDPGFGKAVQWDIPLLGGYDHEFLPSMAGSRPVSGFRRFDCPAIMDRINARKHDALLALTGYANRYGWQARTAAKRARLPFLVRPEASPHTSPPNWLRHLVRNAVARAYYRGCAAVLVIGKRAETFLKRLGIPDERLFPSPYAVDNRFFQDRARELSPQREALRKAMGISGVSLTLLFVGKLQSKKQPLFLAEALKQLARNDVALVVVGDGELRESLLKALKAIEGLRFHFAGFQNQTEVPRYYAVADCLVLPSTYGETWGLVVNEAMNFGCVPLVSDLVGCADDLVSQGSGFVFPRTSPSALAGIINRLVSQPELIADLKQRVRETVSAYSVESAADGIVRASHAVLSTSPHLRLRAASL
jgi:glycosyltransferase involved in cell wall biosynthesis